MKTSISSSLCTLVMLLTWGCADTDSGDTTQQPVNLKADVVVGSDQKTSNQSGTDVTSRRGTDQTIESLQKLQVPKDCKSTPFLDGAKGVTVRDVVVISRPLLKIDKKKKSLDAVYVQTKGGGPWSGMYVVGETDSSIAKLVPGNVVTLTGDVKDFYCMTQMDAQLIASKDGAVETPTAVTVTLSDIGDKAKDEDNEIYESGYVSVENVVVTDNKPLGTDGKTHGEFYVGSKDGDKALLISYGFNTTFSKKVDGAWVADVPMGKKLKSIRGVMTWSYGKWKLIPMEDSFLHWD
jgi:predicted extracellular nuclease